jgi:carboxymethylenebutenolidase
VDQPGYGRRLREGNAEAGKSATSHWYEAEHAFANPTGARYDKEDAQLAWKRTLAFFNKNL